MVVFVFVAVSLFVLCSLTFLVASLNALRRTAKPPPPEPEIMVLIEREFGLGAAAEVSHLRRRYEQGALDALDFEERLGQALRQ